MPLITITTTQSYQPANQASDDSPEQAITASLGEELPAMIVSKIVELHLDPEETVEEGVQVDYALYHPRVVNGVDIWIKIEFAEYGFDDATQRSIRTVLKDMILLWFSSNSIKPPNLALDVFWGPDRSFLIMGSTEVEW